mgnify:CR=1 FL=1
MNDNNISKVIKKYSMRIKESYKVGEIGICDFQMEAKTKKKRDIGVLIEFEKRYKTFDNYML